MRVFKNLLAATAFALVAAAVFGFSLIELFSASQLLLFALGTLLLCAPAFDFKSKRPPAQEEIGEAALYAGILQAFLQLFAALNALDSAEAFSLTVAMSMRPVFYGLLTRAAFVSASAKKQENAPEAPPATAESVSERFVSLGLSRREAEVATLACRGLSNCEIAAELCITESTVKKHISNIFSKLGIARREQLRELIFAQNIVD